MVDGPTEASDHDQTEPNRARIQDFIETVLIIGDHTRLEDFMASDFAEHNANLSDGTESLRAALTEQSNGHPKIVYHHLHRVLAEGNFALSVSEGENTGTHTAFYDLFRLEDGKIVEHWDTTEKVAPKDQWKNENGKF
jgi:predicted SnoaL-like aldol condensation-catalyzing enzyme